MKYLKNLVIFSLFVFSISLYSQETIAILPFTFIDNGQISIQKGKQAQEYLIGYFHKKAKHISVVPLNGRDVTVALNKAGITPETIDNFTTSEIAEAIGKPDYILMGSIDRTLEGSNNLQTGFGTVKQKSYNKTNVAGGSTGTTTNKYNANVNISIFSNNGKVIYEKSKGNIFIDDTANSWENTISWHVSRFPFYK